MSEYFRNHVILDDPRIHSGTNGVCKTWNCFLCGELVGKIEHSTYRMRYEKPYEAMVRIISKDWDRYTRVGWFDSLIEAKSALLEPAREYLAEQELNRQETTCPIHLLPSADSEFYPTPSALAGQLLAGVDWDMVDSVLEPSAGMGNLIDFAQKRSNSYRKKSYYSGRTLDDVDCIELDPNLRAILTGKGYRVVHDDFLDYFTRKRYSLILMNPPFSHGDRHLLHAIELCANGGQIACILNAETIRNPYTGSRMALAKELKRYGATIRFVNDAFAHAPRQARVDVALINLTIPASSADTSIWDELKKAQDVYFESESPQELAPANDIDRLLLEYALLCEAGISLMRKYNGVAPHIQNSRTSKYSKPIITLQVSGHDCDNECSADDVNRFLRSVRSRYWTELFDLPDLRDRMTSAMRDEYHSTIDRMRDYEFSRFNIQQVLDQIRGQIVVGVEEAIIKCFDKLSAEHTYNADIQNDNVHYYNGWKSNKAHCVNIKCVIPTYGCFARGYKRDKYGRYKDTLEGLDTHSCFGVLDDLEKALDYLDRGETWSCNLMYRLQEAERAGQTGNIHCKYFDVTFYKKGTCHVRFRDRKIVDRLNIYVGRQRAWLPPTYGKVHYEEMDEESRRIVDEFQGREAYDAIMESPGDYIIETQAMALLTA